ncbi:MAG: hypothetical protein ACTSV7_04515 [Candidatus Baldrarchaeia archaeon]
MKVRGEKDGPPKIHITKRKGIKVQGDKHPGVYTLTEIKAQIAIGAMTKNDLRQMIQDYQRSAYYLPEDVLKFLEEYLGTVVREKNRFYLREKDPDDSSFD